jgi:rubrerythrin
VRESTMAKLNSETVTNFIKCLSVFESNSSSLYEELANKVESPLMKSLLLAISFDSQKHSALLRGLAQSMPKTNWETNDCPKSIAEAWRSIETFQIELSQIDKISDEDLPDLTNQLVTLEGILSEEYNLLVSFNTIDIVSNGLVQIYNVDFESLKTLFVEIIHDEEHHKEILQMISELLNREVKEEKENVPIVRFRNPDAWSRPAPINS